MICNNCKTGADVYKRALTEHDDRKKKDELSRSKVLHAKCQYPDCYCQHWIKK